MRHILIPALVCSPALASASQSAELQQQIRTADTQLFQYAFQDCNPDKAAAMTTEDMEFFHDKDGKSASNREDFRQSLIRFCEGARQNGVVLRRELVDASLQVYPLQDDRALEMGEHRFHETGSDGVERWVGQGRFVQVWRRMDGAWKLERVVSYDHGAADPQGR